MKGKANINRGDGSTAAYETAHLATRGEPAQAILTRGEAESEEILELKGVILDIFNDPNNTIEFSGYADNGNGKYDFCRVEFTPAG